MNWMNVYVLYDVVSMFVNDVVCDRHSIFKKGDTRVKVSRMHYLGILRRYPDSTSTLESHT